MSGFPGHNAPAKRHVGVMNTQSERLGSPQDRTTGQPNKVVNFAAGQMYAIQYTDKQGQLQDPIVVFVVGDAIYIPPASAQWTAQLQNVDKKAWLYTEISRHIASLEAAEKTPTPKSDDVDVMGEPK